MLRRRGGSPVSVSAPAAVLAAVVLSFAGWALWQAPVAAAEPSISASVGTTTYARPLPAGYVGVSLEFQAVHQYTGRDPRRVNPVLLALLRGLAPGQAPVVRIGGNSADQTWWPLRGVIAPAGARYRLSRNWLATTRAMTSALRARLIVGINLASGRPVLAAAEAESILQGLGRSRIQALEVGNEPDLYPVFAAFRDRLGRVVFTRGREYSISHYLGDFARWRAALPVAPLAGPAFSSLTWLPSLGRLLSREPRIAVATFHRYALRACTTDPSSPSFPSIPNLMKDSSSSGLAAGVARWVGVAHGHGVPFRLDELNSASCRGRRGLSDTFSASLWLLDTLFNLAAVGVDGVNLHTLPGAPYEPFTFSHTGGSWSAFVHPSYYGALMFTRAMPPGSRLLGVAVPAGAVKVWADQGPDGHTRVVVINKDPGTGVHLELSIAGPATPVAVESLRAPSLAATDGVTLDGRSFDPATTTGTLPGPPEFSSVIPVLGRYGIEVPAASALLLTR